MRLVKPRSCTSSSSERSLPPSPLLVSIYFRPKKLVLSLPIIVSYISYSYRSVMLLVPFFWYIYWAQTLRSLFAAKNVTWICLMNVIIDWTWSSSEWTCRSVWIRSFWILNDAMLLIIETVILFPRLFLNSEFLCKLTEWYIQIFSWKEIIKDKTTICFFIITYLIIWA